MKYFRIHPDLLLIANYPKGDTFVRTITMPLSKTKKILLLTDASDEIQHKGFITRTAWTAGRPFSLIYLLDRLIYNHETHTICILYHPELFGRFWTPLLTLLLLLSLRLTGKQITIVFLTTPKIPSQPSIMQALVYFLRCFMQTILRALVHKTISGKQFKGKIVKDMLFPPLS
jgi:hypothetical protein